MTDLLNDKLDKNCIEPQDPGQTLDISHLDKYVQGSITTLCKTYAKAWSKDKFDTGFFQGFQAEMPTLPGTKSYEKERPMKKYILDEVRPMVAELLKEGIFSLADVQGEFASNLNAVPKPQPNQISLGKATAHINRQLGIVKNNQRLCIDLRGVNQSMPKEGKLVLPSYKTLAVQFSYCHCSQFDLTAMYWSIPLKYSDQH